MALFCLPRGWTSTESVLPNLRGAFSGSPEKWAAAARRGNVAVLKDIIPHLSLMRSSAALWRHLCHWLEVRPISPEIISTWSWETQQARKSSEKQVLPGLKGAVHLAPGKLLS